MSNLDTSSSRHYYFVDFFRGIAALMVIIGHYQHFFYLNGHYSKINFDLMPLHSELYFFYHNGGMAVKLFWAISGFVFASVYLHSDLPSAKSFFFKRFARLYPLHFLTLLIVALLQFISLLLTHHFQIYQFNDWYHFLLNVGLVSFWGFQKGYSFNAPIWSVSVEIFVYIVFFLSLKYLKKAPLPVAILFVCAFYFLIEKKTPLYPFKYCGIFFFLGVGMFQIKKYGFPYNGLTCLLSGALILTTIIFSITFPDFNSSDVNLMIRIPFFVLFLSSLDGLDRIQLGHQLKIVGDLSYSMYLVHVPLEIILLLVFEYVGLEKSYFSSELFFIAYLLAVIVISYLSFSLFELPMRNLIWRLSKK